MRALLALALSLAAIAPAGAALTVPGAYRVGEEALPAAICGVRETLWINHYVAGLYVPSRRPPASALQDPELPKVLHIRLLSTSFMPPGLPDKWRLALEAELDPDAYARVQDAYRALHAGDVITVTYSANPGIALYVNGGLVAAAPGHRLIDRLLATWADRDPITTRIERVRARNPCRGPSS